MLILAQMQGGVPHAVIYLICGRIRGRRICGLRKIIRVLDKTPENAFRISFLLSNATKNRKRVLPGTKKRV